MSKIFVISISISELSAFLGYVNWAQNETKEIFVWLMAHSIFPRKRSRKKKFIRREFIWKCIEPTKIIVFFWFYSLKTNIIFMLNGVWRLSRNSKNVKLIRKKWATTIDSAIRIVDISNWNDLARSEKKRKRKKNIDIKK